MRLPFRCEPLIQLRRLLLTHLLDHVRGQLQSLDFSEKRLFH
ncbi:MAG: hypothetical protein QM589_04500 [Thermomicrobiales bacterium]